MDTLDEAKRQVEEIIAQGDSWLGDTELRNVEIHYLDDLQIAMILAKKWGLLEEGVA